jgi:hypothetical protein
MLLLSILSLILLAGRSIALHLDLPRDDSSRGRAPEPTDAHEVESGAFLHRVLMEAYGAERQAWALDRVARVSQRLQGSRPPESRVPVEILWIPECNAFTDGHCVYVSRRLLERCRDDETLAFFVGHEIAHIDLGHFDHAGPFWLWLMQRAAVRPQMERDADRQGLNLCLAAGYPVEGCLKAFDLLESAALDARDGAAVFGPEAEGSRAPGERPAWRVWLDRWISLHRRGYAPIRERKATLHAAYLEAVAGCPSA